MKVAILKTTHRQVNFVSWAIKKVQGTNFSHFAIDINDSIIHATGKDVRILSYEDFFSCNIVKEYIFLEIDADFEKEIYPWMVSVSNRGYGFMQLLGILLTHLKILKRNPFGSGDRKLICNELVLLFLEKFKGIKLEKDSDEYDLNDTSEILRSLKC